MRILPFVAVALLGTALPLAAQTIAIPRPTVRTEVSPIRTQEYEAVSHSDQVDRTTQATDLRFKGDGYDRMTVPARRSRPTSHDSSNSATARGRLSTA